MSCNRTMNSAMKGLTRREQNQSCTVASSYWLEGRGWIGGGETSVREPESVISAAKVSNDDDLTRKGQRRGCHRYLQG